MGGSTPGHMSTSPPIVGPWTGVRPLRSGVGTETWLVNGEEHPFGVLQIARSAEDRVLLRRKARILGRLDHPRLPRVLGGDADGDWLVVDYIEGCSLSDLVGRLTLREAVDVGVVLAMALDHIHQRGVVHGDIHPNNVLIDSRGVPRVLGLGRAWTEEDDHRPSGQPGHAAPELLRGGRPQPASDIYGLGVLLYELVTGLEPYRSADPAALSYLPLTSLPEAPATLRTDLPELLNDLILRMLAQDPTCRPAPARELTERLRTSLRSRSARPVVGMRREREVLRRMVALAANGHPEVVVLHGPAGSGRLTLIREALTAARREGLQVVQLTDGVPLWDSAGPPSVLALDGNRPEHVEHVGRILADDLPWLVLVRADRPLPSLATLGARELEPEPLDRESISLLLEHYGLETGQAEDLLADTGGRAAPVRAWIQERLHPRRHLNRVQRKLVDAVSGGPIKLPVLAMMLGVREHELLDLAEPLIDAGKIEEAEGGEALRGCAQQVSSR